jgi:hypothetical protein
VVRGLKKHPSQNSSTRPIKFMVLREDGRTTTLGEFFIEKLR